jgi:tRNA dimethylallyltransferase
MPKKRVIVIAGPTASGKSQLAIDLAIKFNGVVINADASQVYKGIPIISASPSFKDKSLVEHRLYGYLDNHINGNVVNWLDDAVADIRHVWSNDKISVVVGGSGLYISNLINGTTPISAVDPDIRNQIMNKLNKNGIEALYEELKSVDSKAAEMFKPKDTVRIRRALEIFTQTGISISEWYKKNMIKKLPEADFFVIKLLPPKKCLDKRCDVRFGKMIEQGAIEELKKLVLEKLSPDLPVMRAKGVPELIDYLSGNMSLPQAVELAKIHTRQYAKRQITWFKNKLNADVVLEDCYDGQEDFINNLKKQLHKSV